MFRGFMYMVAITDVHSRRTLNWRVASSMYVEWSTELMKDTEILK